ncbi:MAG TPA: crosslink repair DNA glycosylase YcaQ family protein [Aggregatilineales bacterium]|nr:crosslink repair DNA glycosylase YcaQ family protein [Aggregatilineales bacterium]
MIEITHNQLLNYILNRQGLLTRQPIDSIMDFAPLHATDHTTPYLSLLARIEDFAWENLADRLYASRQFYRLRCMRGTIHLIPAAHKQMIRCIYDLREQDTYREFTEYGISMDEALELRFFITEVLQQYGAQSTATIKKLLDPELIFMHEDRYGHQNSSAAPVMHWMWELGLLDSGAGISDWRKKDNHFRLSDDLPPDCEDAKRTAADVSLARWYFERYAPAAFEDWTWWAGFNVARSRAAFDALQDELVKVKASGIFENLWLFESNVDSLTASPDSVPEMVRLLPYEDALTKAYKDTRYRFYDSYGLAGDVAFSKMGEAYPTIWVDGRIIGTWSWKRKASEPMTVEPFEQITKATRKRLKPEVDRVSHFIDASHILWTT